MIFWENRILILNMFLIQGVLGFWGFGVLGFLFHPNFTSLDYLNFSAKLNSTRYWLFLMIKIFASCLYETKKRKQWAWYIQIDWYWYLSLLEVHIHPFYIPSNYSWCGCNHIAKSWLWLILFAKSKEHSIPIFSSIVG